MCSAPRSSCSSSNSNCSLKQNQFAKDKLALGRVIGLASGQDFNIAESAPYSALAAMTPDQALSTAYGQRADFQSAKASPVSAAEELVKAAHGERYPSVGVTGDYGAVGPDAEQLAWHVHLSSHGQIQHFRWRTHQRRIIVRSPGCLEAASRRTRRSRRPDRLPGPGRSP